MHAPFDFKPVPTKKQIEASQRRLFYFGFYITETEMRDLAKEHNPHYLPCSVVMMEDIDFVLHKLSLVMEDQFEVRLGHGVVRQRHKELLPEMEEGIGSVALVIYVLSTDHYKAGYRPSNREMEELQQMLMDRKPCWWEAVE